MRVFVAATLAAAIAIAQQTPAPGKKYRTAPTGYPDGPVLPDGKWRVHDIARPKPRVVTPGPAAGAPPSDAIVLFDGKDLSKWHGEKGGKKIPPGWRIGPGYVEATGGAGSLVTNEAFGDFQLHIEWATPTEIDGDSQWRGNSGIMPMGRYEIQVLDSYNNPTYADGQAASMYGQYPPLVNASRKPGEWQVYDMVFEAPRWNASVLVKPARLTLFHNGVLMHNAKEFIGQVAHKDIRHYEPHAAELPLTLQDHDVPVRFRNIWIRKLKGYDQQ